MSAPMSVKIVGMGRYLPERIVPSSEVEAMCGLPPGWIEARNGVRERRWVNRQESNSFMGAEAAKEAVAEAGLSLTDIDLIINASGTNEQAIPDGGPLVQRALGLGDSGIPCFTIHATCLSFLRALDVAAAYLTLGRHKNILIITSDTASYGLNFKDPTSASLFGDAACAVVLSNSPAGDSAAMLETHFETYGNGADFTAVYGGGSKKHPNHPDTKPEDNLFYMEGTNILLLLRRVSRGYLENLRPGLSSDLGSIKLVVPHQASKYGLQFLQIFNWPAENIMETLSWMGNCVSASTPATLYQAVKDGRIQRGDEVLMICTGAGLSIGGIILRY